MQGQILFAGGKMGVARPVLTAADSLENAGAGAMNGTVTGSAQVGDAAGVGESNAVQTGSGILDAIRNRPAVKRKAEDKDQEEEVGDWKCQSSEDELSEVDGDEFDDFNASIEDEDAEKYVREGVFEFLELPSEIRVMVYEYVRAADIEMRPVKSAAAMVGISRQVRQEALPIMFHGLSLLLDLDMLCSCESCESNSESVYPRQMLALRYGILHYETLPRSYTNGAENLFGHRVNDYTLDILSYLKKFRIQLSQDFGHYTFQGYLEIELPSNPHVGTPTISVHISDPGMRRRYEYAFEGLLVATVGYWTDRHGECRFSKEFLDHVTEPAKIIHRTIQHELDLG